MSKDSFTNLPKDQVGSSTTDQFPALLTEPEVARLLRVKPCTVRNERVRKRLGFTPVGARIFYSSDQLKEYIENQQVKACADKNPDPAKSESIGSAKSQDALDQTIRGARRTTKIDRHVVSALAQATFKRRASR